jgi:hypothetical protein
MFGNYSDETNLAWSSVEGQTWSSMPSLDTLERPNALLFTNGQFLAGGDYGDIAVSTTGNTWASLGGGSSRNMRGVAYGNGRFVVVGNDGMTATSLEDHNWTWHSSPTTRNLHEVIFNRGLFIAVGNHGTILTSSNGVSWTAQSSGTTEDLYGITGGANGLLVAVGGSLHSNPYTGGWYEHIILVSADGVVWEDRTPGFENITLHGVTYGQGLFVAVGGPVSDATICTSTNGTNWVLCQTPPESWYMKGVAYGNRVFVAVGEDDWFTNNWLLISSNAVDWRRIQTCYTGWFNPLDDIIFRNGSFMVVGDSGLILTSTDGLDWTVRHSPTTTHLRGITYGGGTFVIVGNNDTILQSSLDPVQLLNPQRSGNTSTFQFNAKAHLLYQPQYQTNLNFPWIPIPAISNRSGTVTISHTNAGFNDAFFRLLIP